MSDPTAADMIRGLLGPLDGAKIPGGCDQCDAYQTTALVDASVWEITVHHDPGCPILAAHEKRRPA